MLTPLEPALNGRRISQAQGKLLGGSSSINAQALIPFSKLDIDSWEALGNTGWNWDSVSPYLEKAFTISIPDEQTVEHLSIEWAEQLRQSYHGLVNASFADVKENPLGRAWVNTFERLGFPLSGNPFRGRSTGAYNGASTINAATKTKSSASSAYYTSLTARSNVEIFLSTTAEKLVLEPTYPQPIVKGISVLRNGTSSTIHARQEVILSSGVFNTPKLLELSGIGDASILTTLGIDVKVVNPNVGHNLQDHILCSISFEAQEGIQTGDDLIREDPVALQSAMELYQTHQAGPFATPGITSFGYLPPVEFDHEPQAFDAALKALSEGMAGESPMDAARRNHVWTIHQNRSEGTSQYFLFMAQAGPAGKDTTGPFSIEPQPGNYISLVSALSHPLSAGTSHIVSTDVNEPPMIDHRYLQHPLDLEFHGRHVRYLETIAATEPLASLLKPNGRRNDPQAFVGADLDKAKAYVRNMSTTNWHSCGTCAMAPRDKGGVVDSDLRVYGVSGLRIVDASVFPFIPQSNLQSLVYAVAEKASDIIMAGR
jgi:choline dehydrogenase-like flavoprotein